MRRVLELMALSVTLLALVATSRAPEPCSTESVTLRIASTCGEPGTIVVASDVGCTATVTQGAEDAGLPTRGSLFGSRIDAGALGGFSLFGPTTDGGLSYTCNAVPGDGGLDLTCEPHCAPDGGVCPDACTGTLTP